MTCGPHDEVRQRQPDDAVVEHPDGALVEPTGDGLALYLPSPGSLHLLDPPAALVWQLADGRAAADVCSAVATKFPETPGLREDVLRTLDDMVARGLLVGHR